MKANMNTRKNCAAVLAAMSLFAASATVTAPAFAFGNFLKKIDINKVLETTKKAVEANKDITEPEEIEMGKVSPPCCWVHHHFMQIKICSVM